MVVTSVHRLVGCILRAAVADSSRGYLQRAAKQVRLSTHAARVIGIIIIIIITEAFSSKQTVSGASVGRVKVAVPVAVVVA